MKKARKGAKAIEYDLDAVIPSRVGINLDFIHTNKVPVIPNLQSTSGKEPKLTSKGRGKTKKYLNEYSEQTETFLKANNDYAATLSETEQEKWKYERSTNNPTTQETVKRKGWWKVEANTVLRKEFREAAEKDFEQKMVKIIGINNIKDHQNKARKEKYDYNRLLSRSGANKDLKIAINKIEKYELE